MWHHISDPDSARGSIAVRDVHRGGEVEKGNVNFHSVQIIQQVVADILWEGHVVNITATRPSRPFFPHRCMGIKRCIENIFPQRNAAACMIDTHGSVHITPRNEVKKLIYR